MSRIDFKLMLRIDFEVMSRFQVLALILRLRQKILIHFQNSSKIDALNNNKPLSTNVHYPMRHGETGRLHSVKEYQLCKVHNLFSMPWQTLIVEEWWVTFIIVPNIECLADNVDGFHPMLTCCWKYARKTSLTSLSHLAFPLQASKWLYVSRYFFCDFSGIKELMAAFANSRMFSGKSFAFSMSKITTQLQNFDYKIPSEFR